MKAIRVGFVQQGKFMKRIEIIRIRLAQSYNNEMLSEIQELAGSLGRPVVRIYRHAAMDSDFNIHLHFESSELMEGISELGSYLVSRLKGVGLVNHSIWIELEESFVNAENKGGKS